MGCSCKGYKSDQEFHPTEEPNNSNPIQVQRPKKVVLFIVKEEESKFEHSNVPSNRQSCVQSKRQSLAACQSKTIDHLNNPYSTYSFPQTL